MLAKATSHSLIRGMCPPICPGGIMCPLYADDTILFLENNVEQAKNLKWVLTCFEQVLGMKINYNKSELIPISLEDDELLAFIEILRVWL